MNRLALLLITASLSAGCGDDPTEPEIRDISGSWSYTESFSSSSAGFSCQNEGTVVISQNGSNFSGTYNQEGVCSDSSGNLYDNSGSGSISGGQIDGTRVSFNAGSCSYDGSVTGSPPNRLSGSVNCTIAAGGQNYLFTGNWQASR